MSDKMITQFKEFGDLQAFAKAQQKTLIELTKKNKSYEDEIKHLKKLLEGAVPVIANKPVDFASNDEESIAREQLFRLKQLSNEKELTLEEAKRVEIFSKILTALKGKPKDINGNSKQLSEKELLAIVGTDDDANNK
jgi:hypothetical protein